MKLKLFSLLLAVAAGVGTMFAWDYERVQIGDLYYNLDATNQTAEVTSQYSIHPYWSTTVTTANIPASVTYSGTTYSVTSIGEWAFSYCDGLTSVTIPNSVTSIGDWAFMYCTNLTSVTIPNSVTSIGSRVFSGCVSLPVIDNVRYAGTYLVEAVDKTLSTYTIKEGTRYIGWEAFRTCTGLTSVTIPNSVTSIGDGAFWGCSGLTSVTIPNSVISIGDYAFCNCSGLAPSIEIPNSVTKVGIYAFSGCDFTSIKAPAAFFDVAEGSWPNYTKILNHVIVNAGELTENALLFINRSYKTLQTLDVSGVTNTEFADEAFKGYYNLQQLVLPEGLQKVSYMMVAGCKNLQSIDIPASVEEIEQSAFEDCRSIQSITFGGAPAGAPGRAAAPAASSQLKKIGNWAFYNAHELQHLNIPEGVEEIGDGAFYGCTYLEDMILPSSIRAIGDNCFALCGKLTKIVCNATMPPAIQAKTFYDVNRLIPVYVPDESVASYESDTYWQEFDIQGASDLEDAVNYTTDNPAAAVTKVMLDGQVLILRNGKTYTLQGVEVK